MPCGDGRTPFQDHPRVQSIWTLPSWQLACQTQGSAPSITLSSDWLVALVMSCDVSQVSHTQ